MITRFKILGSIFFFFILLSFFTKSSFAAVYTLYGSVKDSSGIMISGATIDVRDAVSSSEVSNATSDSSGNYSLSVNTGTAVTGTYNITLTPPVGSNYTAVNVPNYVISSNSSLNFFLVHTGSVVLSGHLYDSLGNPLAGQQVSLKDPSGGVVSTTTDGTGSYSLQDSAGDLWAMRAISAYNLHNIDMALQAAKNAMKYSTELHAEYIYNQILKGAHLEL